MSHALPRPLPHALPRSLSRPHPDAGRIAGQSAAIAANALLLMLLLVPMQTPPALTLPGLQPPTISWYLPQPKPPVPPPTVEITRPQPQQPPSPATLAPRQPPTATVPVVVEHGSAPAPDPAPTPETAGPSTLEPSAALPGVRLEYAQAPAPVYPRAAQRMGVEGTVLLQVLVDVDGRPLQVDIRHSSGDRRLDAAARDQVLGHWRFRPALRDGRAVQALGLVPIHFRLER